MFRRENTVPKTSFASSSFDRPFRRGLLLLSPLVAALRPSAVDAVPLDCGRDAETGLLLFVLALLEDEEAAWSHRLEYIHSAAVLHVGVWALDGLVDLPYVTKGIDGFHDSFFDGGISDGEVERNYVGRIYRMSRRPFYYSAVLYAWFRKKLFSSL